MRNLARAFSVWTVYLLCIAAHDARAAIKSEGIPPLQPPQGKLEEPLVERVHWPWFIVAGCHVAGAILMWPRKRRVQVKEDPAVCARRQLRDLRHPSPVAIGAILREYIIATHAVPGPGQTFDQLARVLAADPRWTLALRDRFQQLADPLEIAKFAPGASAVNFEPLRDEALALIEAADALQRPPVPGFR
jgi:hypothetical protein